MVFTVRDLTADDAAEAAALLNIGASEPVNVEQMRERLRGQAPGRIVARLGAADETGRLAGYGHALRDGWMGAGLFWMYIVVEPATRRQGAGSELHRALLDFASGHGATTLRGEARDNAPDDLRFAERRGWRIDRHIFESTLELATFDERPFIGALHRTEAAGVHFTSMAALGDTPEARRRLYELERVVARDIPGGSESAIRPFEAFVREVCDSQHYVADGQLMALDAAQGEARATWVGLAAVLHYTETNSMYNGITGVLPAYRDRSIATALKLLAIRVAKRHNAAYIRTNNDSENAPMLAINRKLGYRPEPGYYRMIAEIGPEIGPSQPAPLPAAR